MARRFFSGNSLEQAILQAASHYGIDPEQVAYSVREKKHGFVNVRRRAVIEVDPEQPQKVVAETPTPTVGNEAPTSASQDLGEEAVVAVARDSSGSSESTDSSDSSEQNVGEETEDFDQPVAAKAEQDIEKMDAEVRSSNDGEEVVQEDNFDDDLDGDEYDEDDIDEDDEDDEDDLDQDPEASELDKIDAAYEKAVRLLIRLIDLDLDYSIEEEDGTFFVEFYGPDSDDLLEDDGEALRAIGHLLPRLVRGLAGESWPCKVDCEGFEEARVQELEELAERVAEEVRTEGKATLLESMNPADRRVVHLALAEDPEVETYSEGDGFMKRVKIVPA